MILAEQLSSLGANEFGMSSQGVQLARDGNKTKPTIPPTFGPGNYYPVPEANVNYNTLAVMAFPRSSKAIPSIFANPHNAMPRYRKPIPTKD